MKTKTSIPKRMELIFDLFYLISGLILSLILLITGTAPGQQLWGIMGLILIGGDAFHLIPRILTLLSDPDDTGHFRRFLGLGKQITSVTMTIFYLILWHLGLLLYNLALPGTTLVLYLLAGARILLCLLPQNKWTAATPSYRWGIYRNIPFLFQGLIVILLFALNAGKVSALSFVWLAVLLSFAFYLPVVLFAEKHPKCGMLMLPKTIMYFWIICMGLFLS